MIDVNSLKKGNWITFVSDPTHFERVEDIQTYDLCDPAVNRVSVNDVAPIILTEEIALKFAEKFETIDNPILQIYEIGRFNLFFNKKRRKLDYITYDNVTVIFNVNDYYLHLFQNTYYFLENKELNIELSMDKEHINKKIIDASSPNVILAEPFLKETDNPIYEPAQELSIEYAHKCYCRPFGDNNSVEAKREKAISAYSFQGGYKAAIENEDLILKNKVIDTIENSMYLSEIDKKYICYIIKNL